MVRPCSHRRGRHGRGLLLLLLSWTILNGLVFVAPPRAPARASARGLVTLQADAEPEPDEKRSWPARYFLAAKDAIQTALFGSPESPETASNAPHNPLEGVTGVILNATSTAVSGATSGVKAVEAAAGSCGSWCGSRLQELGSALHLTSESGGSAEVAAADASEAPEAPAGGGLFQEAPDSGAQPGDFFLFIKDYSWSLRYRVRNQSDSVDIERPLLLDWIKLRQPVRDPNDVLEIPSSDLFDWDVVEPPRHKGFMYQVTQVVGSGVEAVINFFKDRGPKLLVQQEGVSLVDEKAPDMMIGKPVTHCWVQCLGLPFLPVLQYIAFLNHDEIVTDWRA